MRQIKGLVIETQKAINALQLQVETVVKSLETSQEKTAEMFTRQTESSETLFEAEKNEESNQSNINCSDTDDSTEFEVIQSTKGTYLCLHLQP